MGAKGFEYFGVYKVNSKAIIVMYRTYGIHNGRGFQPYHIFHGLLKNNLLEKMYVFRLRNKKDKHLLLKPLPFVYLAFIYILMKINSKLRLRKVGGYLFNLPFFDFYIFLSLFNAKGKTIIFNYYPSQFLLKRLKFRGNKVVLYGGQVHPKDWKEFLKRGIKDLEYNLSSKALQDINRQFDLLKYFDQYIVMSKYSKQTWLQESKPIDVVPLGVEQIDYKMEYTNNEKIIFVYIGRITYEKGLKYLLDAWENIDSSQCKCELWFVGGLGKSEENYFTNRFKNLQNFKYLGYQNSMEILKQADVLIHPTLAGGFEKVTLEATVMGLAIITTEPAAHFIKDGQNGFIIEQFSSNQIKDKIEFFLQNRKKIQEFGEKGKKSVSNQTWKKFENDYVNVIKNFSGETNGYYKLK